MWLFDAESWVGWEVGSYTPAKMPGKNCVSAVSSSTTRTASTTSTTGTTIRTLRSSKSLQLPVALVSICRNSVLIQNDEREFQTMCKLGMKTAAKEQGWAKTRVELFNNNGQKICPKP